MRRLLLSAALACVAAAGSTPSSAQTRIAYAVDGETLFTLVAPEGWRARRGFGAPEGAPQAGVIAAPKIVTMAPDAPRGLMWAGFWAPAGLADIESPAAARFARALAAGLLEEIGEVSSRMLSVDGMAVRLYSGAGAYRPRGGPREAVRFELALAQLPGGRVAAGAFVGSAQARAAHGAGLDAMLASLRAAATPRDAP